MARLATILSFGDRAEDDAAPEHAAATEEYRDQEEDDAASDASGDSFEFSFARPLGLAPGEGDALADDLFAHGRILPAYPVFHHRRQAHDDDDASASSATAPPSPDTYCAWAPRSAPGSPAREPAAAFPKSASTGTGEAARRFRLRDILGAAGRSHSDGKEKFLFFQPPPAKPKPGTSALSSSAAAAPAAGADKRAVKKASPQKQGKKKAVPAAATEMDMATAHRLFYSKPGAAAGAGGERTTTATKKSYLPYRPAIVGFFAAAHGLRPKHHPY